jgi:DNA-binding transcriptional MerR regulator
LGKNSRSTAPAADADGALRIGELARQTNVSRRTIRYYEELGILPKPPRSAGGTRKYPSDYRFYVEGALSLKEVGFSLDEIKLLGRLAMGKSMPAAQRARAVTAIREKMQTLEHKIRVLNRIHDILEQQGKDSANKSRRTTGPTRRSAGSARSSIPE